MDQIKEDLLKMSGLVEEALDLATRAITNRDAAVAKEVIRNDFRVNEMENIIEQRCIRLIATHQPVAVDLRFLTSALRICTELERIGDQSVNLAQRSLTLIDLPPMEDMNVPGMLIEMADLAKAMTRQCLDAFVQQDPALAYDVCCQDDELDDLNRNLLEKMITWMMEEQRLIRRGVEIILAGRHYERIGDQATNISEAVVYLVEGTVIRHQGADFCQKRREVYSDKKGA